MQIKVLYYDALVLHAQCLLYCVTIVFINYIIIIIEK